MAPTVRHLTPLDHHLTRWKNGRGTTRQIATWPLGATLDDGDLCWRVALAGVAERGPFSQFPGYERLLVITRGAGLLLEHDGDAPRAALAARVPYRFNGDWSTIAEPVGGPVEDLNVLFDGERVQASVEVLQLGARRWRGEVCPAGTSANSDEAAHVLLHVCDGNLRARFTGEEEAFELHAGETLLASELVGAEELDLAGRADDTLALLITLLPAAR